MPSCPWRPYPVLLALLCACGDGGPSGDTEGSSGGPAGTGTTAGPGGTDATDPSGEPSTGSGSNSNSNSTGTTTDDDPTGPDPSGDPSSDPSDTSPPPDMGGEPTMGRCGDEPPPGAVLAPDIPAFGGSCPVIETGFFDEPPNVLPQTAGGQNYDRRFLVIVPDDMADDERLPVMFMWHWLGGSAKDFYERAVTQEAVNQKRFIAIIPDGRETDQGVLFKWPFTILDSEDQLESEFKFFEDMLSCVHEQFAVDKDCVSSVGVSAGALFTSQLAGHRGDRLASFLSLSGGTGGTFVKPWQPPAHKLPGLVLWGGPDDFCVAIDFEQTSHDLEQNLVEGGHFVVECIHNCNHSTPPFPATEGQTAFAPLWDFMLDHPYWLKPGESPYNSGGLPVSMPEWCAVGVGNAVPPAGTCDQNECS